MIFIFLVLPALITGFTADLDSGEPTYKEMIQEFDTEPTVLNVRSFDRDFGDEVDDDKLDKDLRDYLNNPEEGLLHEGDLVLTPQQRKELNERKAITAILWTEVFENQTIDYYISSTAKRYETVIEKGLAHWQQHTCIRFRKLINATLSPSLHFTSHRGGCWSFMGRQNKSQAVHIGKGCHYMGVVLHEIGHALGFQHEHSRQDRDNYVKINMQNIRTNKTSNFNKVPSTTFGIPYDLLSIMHYNRRAFGKNNSVTIETLDSRYSEIPGQRGELSHRDKQIVNAAYQCSKSCPEIDCQNGGFVGKSCTCICPFGTSGNNCETQTFDYYGEMTSEGNITSPNYPEMYPILQNRYWFISAPQDHRISVEFTEATLMCPIGKHGCVEYIQFEGKNGVKSDRFCNQTLKSTTWQSQDNELVIRFRSYFYNPSSSKYSKYCNTSLTLNDTVGFSAQVKFVESKMASNESS